MIIANKLYLKIFTFIQTVEYSTHRQVDNKEEFLSYEEWRLRNKSDLASDMSDKFADTILPLAADILLYGLDIVHEKIGEGMLT